MSLLAKSVRKSKRFSLKKRASNLPPKTPEPVLPSSTDLSEFAQVRTKKRATDLSKFAKVCDKKRATFYEGLPPDLFDIENELGQEVIEALYIAIEDAQAQGSEILPAMPTVSAYQAELALLEAIAKGRIAEPDLRDLVRSYIETHTFPPIGKWTEEDIPLFYISIMEGSKTVKGYTANYIQVCIIRELWLRTSPEASFDLTRL